MKISKIRNLITTLLLLPACYGVNLKDFLNPIPPTLKVCSPVEGETFQAGENIEVAVLPRDPNTTGFIRMINIYIDHHDPEGNLSKRIRELDIKPENKHSVNVSKHSHCNDPKYWRRTFSPQDIFLNDQVIGCLLYTSDAADE